jgi:hypothetical protein
MLSEHSMACWQRKWWSVYARILYRRCKKRPLKPHKHPIFAVCQLVKKSCLIQEYIPQSVTTLALLSGTALSP